jgi:site-specific DNA-cytosine methylase
MQSDDETWEAARPLPGLHGDGAAMLTFGSWCSGIEAASEAWLPLGWSCAYVAEIEPFPCAYLAQTHGAGRPRYMPDPAEAETEKERRRRSRRPPQPRQAEEERPCRALTLR